MKKFFLIFIIFFYLNNIISETTANLPEVKVSNNTELEKSLNNAAKNLFLNSNIDLFVFNPNDEKNKEIKKNIAEWDKALGQLKYYINKLSGIKNSGVIFEEFAKFEEGLYLKIVVIANLGKELKKNKQTINSFYFKFLNEISSSYNSLLKSINNLSGSATTKNILRNILNNIFLEIIKKWQRDVSKRL